MDAEMRLYQMGYFLRGDLDEEKALETEEKIRKIIEDAKGIITQENKPQKKKLSFNIKKHENGYFGSFSFMFPNETIKELKKSLEKMEIIRFLLNRTKQEEQVKSRHYSKKITKPQIIEKSTPTIEKGEIEQKESLQVEEIDKKLEEILGQ